jgi:hypothetical protein
LATNDANKAADLRQKIWGKLSGGIVNGKEGSLAQIEASFIDWKKAMNTNLGKKRIFKPMKGFILPLEDNRSATLKLG